MTDRMGNNFGDELRTPPHSPSTSSRKLKSILDSPNLKRGSPTPDRNSNSPSPSRSKSTGRSTSRSISASRSRSRSYSGPPSRRRRSSSPKRRKSTSRDRGRYRSPPYRRRSPYRQRSRSPYSHRRRSSDRRRRTPPRSGTHLFVAGLNFTTTDKEVERKFEKYGDVILARIVRNSANGESRGFGFVEMKNEDGANKAIRHLDSEEWHGRRLLVERARTIR